MKRLSLLYIVVICTMFLGVTVYAQSVESLMRSGNMLLKNGVYDQAVSKYRKVIARDPENFEARYNLAFAYLEWGRYSNAVKEFRKAININPRSAEAWSNLAMAYQNLGQSGKAINAMYQAVETNPKNVQARINLATVYASRGRVGDAIVQYKRVLQIDGTNIDAHINLATCLISRKRYKEAKHYLKGAIAINPNDPEAYWELGNILSDKDKDYEGAIKNYRKAIMLKPNSQVYYKNLGLLLEELWKKNRDNSKKTDAIDVWKKYVVALDDALEKESIQDRIEILERGESPSGKATPEELFGKTGVGKEDVEKMRKEMGKGEGEVEAPAQRITVEDYDLVSDLDDLDKEEEGGAFDFDMKKAIEKKKKEMEEENK